MIFLVPTTITTLTSTGPFTQIHWSFDNHLNDSYNVYNGIGLGNVDFFSSGYNGRGAALWLNGTQNSVHVVVQKFLNITYRSFTWEMWVYPFSIGNCRLYTLLHEKHSL